MRAMVLNQPGLDKLTIEDRPDPGRPGPGDIRVALHGSTLNYHDLGIATGRSPTRSGRVLLADGAGTVEAVGDGAALEVVAGLVRDAGCAPVIVGARAEAKGFQRGGPAFRNHVGEAELRRLLGT